MSTETSETSQASDTSEGVGSGRYVEPARMPGSVTTSTHQLTTHDGAQTAGILHTVPGATCVAVLMHPRQDLTHHVLVPELLSRGIAVWTQGARGVGSDLALLHEQTLLDMAAGHVLLRARGFESVVSVGHSGGATLAAFYLQQAALPPGERLTDTPSGKPIPLGEAEMPVADGLVLMAPHPGQGQLLLRMIDPSVTDENDPMSVDPTLDPYAAANGFTGAGTSYAPEFVERYRAAQLARVTRIDAEARERADAANDARRRFRDSDDPADRRRALAAGVVTVHRTDADLRGVDLSLDPNDRPYGSLFGSRPDLTNYGIVGFGRLATPEAWLSTWSALSTRADLAACAPGVHVPTLLVELTGDQACFPADAARFTALIGHDDTTRVSVAGRHFGAPLHRGMTSGATLAGERIGGWVGERFPLGSLVSA